MQVKGIVQTNMNLLSFTRLRFSSDLQDLLSSVEHEQMICRMYIYINIPLKKDTLAGLEHHDGE